jgi:hypothetical protein
VGLITINLAEYADPDSPAKMVRVGIEKCPDKDAYLEFKIQSSIVQNLGISDTMSTMSGLDDICVDSGPETEYDFKDDIEDKAEPTSTT